MPMRQRSLATEGEVHPNPFLGPVDHRVAIRVDVSGLTSREVDAYGFLKPGVPLRKNGTLAGAPAMEKEVFVNGGAAGNITISGIVAADRILEVTYFPVSGGNVTGVQDLTAEFSITANDTINNTGGTATTDGRLRVRYLDVSALDYIYGCVVEAVKVHTSNSGLGSVTDDIDVAVCVMGVINRAILEDSLGSALTANEEAAFLAPGCHIVLT